MRAMKTLTKTGNRMMKYQVFWTRLARIGQIGLISDYYINFQKSRHGLNDHNRPENIKYTKFFNKKKRTKYSVIQNK